MAEVSRILGKPKNLKRYTPDNRLVLPRDLIGLEFEYEGVKDPGGFFDEELALFWTLHRDDSLKDYGSEFTFRDPMFGEDAVKAIELLMAKAAKIGLKCSSRCGIHVHSDARNMEAQQLIGQTILYAIVEPLLFRWIGDDRENSIYCIPFYKADDSLVETCNVIKALYTDDTKKTQTTLKQTENFSRYAAYNLQALHKFGSVEFRHMRTTHDFKRVMNWINMILSLKAATIRFATSDGAIIRLAQNSPANVFLSMVFGDELAKELWWDDTPALINKVGIPSACDMVLYGLSSRNFEELNLPSGNHAGFQKWLEKKKVDKANEKKKDTPPAQQQIMQPQAGDVVEADNRQFFWAGNNMLEAQGEPPQPPRPFTDRDPGNGRINQAIQRERNRT